MDAATLASTVLNLRHTAERERKDGNEARAKELELEASLYEGGKAKPEPASKTK